MPITQEKEKIALNTFGLNQSKIRKLMLDTCLNNGKTEGDYKEFERSFRASINKKGGFLSGKEFSAFFKSFEEWINDAA